MIRLRPWCLLLLLFACRGHAAETLVSGTSEYPPYGFLRDGRVVGADTELVQSVVRLMGYSPDIRLLPWSRVEQEAAQGRIDLVFGMTWSEERARRYYLSEPISESRDVFFKRRDETISFSSLAELSAYRIGTSAGYQYAPEFMELVARGQLTVEPVYGEVPELRNLMKLARGRIDLFICDFAACDFYLRTQASSYPELAGLDYIGQVIGEGRQFRVGFPRMRVDAIRDLRAARLQLLFDRALRALPLDERRDIRRRYGIGELPRP